MYLGTHEFNTGRCTTEINGMCEVATPAAMVNRKRPSIVINRRKVINTDIFSIILSGIESSMLRNFYIPCEQKRLKSE